MMCDGVEAASKSLKNPDFIKINEFVENNRIFVTGQQTGGNYFEIELIKKVLINKLINIFHIRIEYPQ